MHKNDHDDDDDDGDDDGDDDDDDDDDDGDDAQHILTIRYRKRLATSGRKTATGIDRIQANPSLRMNIHNYRHDTDRAAGVAISTDGQLAPQLKEMQHSQKQHLQNLQNNTCQKLCKASWTLSQRRHSCDQHLLALSFPTCYIWDQIRGGR